MRNTETENIQEHSLEVASGSSSISSSQKMNTLVVMWTLIR